MDIRKAIRLYEADPSIEVETRLYIIGLRNKQYDEEMIQLAARLGNEAALNIFPEEEDDPFKSIVKDYPKIGAIWIAWLYEQALDYLEEDLGSQALSIPYPYQYHNVRELLEEARKMIINPGFYDVEERSIHFRDDINYGAMHFESGSIENRLMVALRYIFAYLASLDYREDSTKPKSGIVNTEFMDISSRNSFALLGDDDLYNKDSEFKQEFLDEFRKNYADILLKNIRDGDDSL